MSDSNIRHRGYVKFFNPTKGYGFIVPEEPIDKDVEVFVHHTAIYNNGGFKSLAEGELVEYNLIKGDKGFHASNVTGPDHSFVQGDRKLPQKNYYRNGYDFDDSVGGYVIEPYYNGGYIVYYAQLSTSALYNGQAFIPN